MKPIHKNTVKAMIRKGIIFKGYIAPNNVNSRNINSGWHIGMAVEFSNLQEMEDTLSNFAYYNCIPELGMRIRFCV
jgi:hypothetical protein